MIFLCLVIFGRCLAMTFRCTIIFDTSVAIRCIIIFGGCLDMIIRCLNVVGSCQAMTFRCLFFGSCLVMAFGMLIFLVVVYAGRLVVLFFFW